MSSDPCFAQFFQQRQDPWKDVRRCHFLDQFQIMVIFLCAEVFFFSPKNNLSAKPPCARMRSSESILLTPFSSSLKASSTVIPNSRFRDHARPKNGNLAVSVIDTIQIENNTAFQHFFLSFSVAHTDTVFFSATLISSFSCSSSVVDADRQRFALHQGQAVVFLRSLPIRIRRPR